MEQTTMPMPMSMPVALTLICLLASVSNSTAALVVNVLNRPAAAAGRLPGIDISGHYYQSRQAHDDCSSSSSSRRSVLGPPQDRSRLKLALNRRVEPLLSQRLAMDAERRRVFNSRQLRASGRRRIRERRTKTSTAAFESSIESGAVRGSGEYFAEAFIGTPPVRLLLIVDTGSDLTWTQCRPCSHCFQQEDQLFDPSGSSSYSPVPCHRAECSLVPHTCTAATTNCDYFYSYGDNSNTTGDLAYETLRLNLQAETAAVSAEVTDLVVGCGHSNQGLFRGASGLLGLGRGPLSFVSQLGSSSMARSFSYCLVPRESAQTSSISFGDKHGQDTALQFTPFTGLALDTFYYLDITELRLVVGGQEPDRIPAAGLRLRPDGSGGTIIDSGTTLSYLAQPTYQLLEAAVVSRMQQLGHPRVQGPDILPLCYNTTFDRQELGLNIVFGNGAVMRLPRDNVFIRPEPDQPVQCLAILPSQDLSMSILGNFQQQNMRLLYDVEAGRLGFANMDCSSSSLQT